MTHGLRQVWQIGDLNFMATKDNGGWWITGLIGGLAIMDDVYSDKSIIEIMEYTAGWAREYAYDLLVETETFTPSDFL